MANTRHGKSYLTVLVMAAALGLTSLLVAGGRASAGVVITERETTQYPGGKRTETIRMMVQGNKQRTVTSRTAIVTDLDRGITLVIDPATRSYFETPFPPHSEGISPAAVNSLYGLTFRPTGKTRKLLGFTCDEYEAKGTVMGNRTRVVGCFSKSAPGASEIVAFQRTMSEKLNASAIKPAKNAPTGVPLSSRSTTWPSPPPLPGMSPEQAAAMQKQAAKSPPVVSDTVVTAIAVKHLPPSTFEAPASYTRRSMPAMGPTGVPMPPPGVKVPE